MQNNKFSSPQRMSRSALPVIYFNLMRSEYQELIAFLIIIFIGNDNLSPVKKILYPALAILLYLLYIGVRMFVKYHFLKFHVANSSLIISRGMFHKETLSIPTYKIYSMRTKSGFFYRLFDMKGVSFDTLASKGKEAELILDDADWDALLELVKDEKPVTADVIQDEAVCSENTEPAGRSISLGNLDLIKGAFCQNHLKGTLVIGAALAALLGQIDYSFLKQAAEYATDKVDLMSLTVSTIIVLLAVLYFVSLLLWLGKVMLRYYDMKLNISDEKLFFESGLITRRSIRFAHDKVCTLLIKTNPLEKIMKCSTVSLQQAFNITDEKMESDVLIYGCRIHDVLMQWWLGADCANSESIMKMHSGRGLFWYSIRYKLAVILIISALLIYEGFAEYTVIAALCLLFVSLTAVLTVRRSSLELKDGYMVITSGSIARKTTYIKYSNIEHVSIRSSLFTPRFRRVHLVINTNGSSSIIRSLNQKDAQEAYDIMLNKLYGNK